MIHLQYNTQDWDQALYRLSAGALVKLVDMVQTSQEVKNKNPGLKTVLRHVNNTGYIWTLNWAENVARAEAEYRTYIDGTFANYAQWVDYVEEPRNEYVDNGMTGDTLEMRIQWARACAYVWKTVFQTQWPWIKCLIGNVPVGNNIPLGFAQAAHDFGAGIAAHAYIHFSSPGIRDPLDFIFHSGRWVGDDALFRSQGLHVPIAITETGPYKSTWDGWRSPVVLNGDIDGYVETMRDWIRDCRDTVPYQEGRLLGFCLFTTINSGWDFYKTNQPELNALADMVKQEWIPVSPPPPIERVPGTDASHWNTPINFTINFNAGGRWFATKATEGTTYADPTMTTNLSGAKASGQYRTAYHFYLAGVNPIQQADWFADHIPADLDFPPILDLEDVPSAAMLRSPFLTEPEDSSNITHAIRRPDFPMGSFYAIAADQTWFHKNAITASLPTDVKAFLDRVMERTGWKKLLIYTSPGYWNAYMGVQSWQNDHDLFVAHWTTAPEPTLPVGFTSWKFWQYTSIGSGPAWGFSSKYADLGRFNGNTDDLYNYVLSFGNPQPPGPYRVVVNLLPPETLVSEVFNVVTITHDGRETMLYSADDAVTLVLSGNADSVAKVWNADRWSGDIEAWLRDRGVQNIELHIFPDWQ